MQGLPSIGNVAMETVCKEPFLVMDSLSITVTELATLVYVLYKTLKPSVHLSACSYIWCHRAIFMMTC